jgi:hypothetical protein
LERIEHYKRLTTEAHFNCRWNSIPNARRSPQTATGYRLGSGVALTRHIQLDSIWGQALDRAIEIRPSSSRIVSRGLLPLLIKDGRYQVRCTIANIAGTERSVGGTLPLHVKDGVARIALTQMIDGSPVGYLEVDQSQLLRVSDGTGGPDFTIHEVLDGGKLRTDWG